MAKILLDERPRWANECPLVNFCSSYYNNHLPCIDYGLVRDEFDFNWCQICTVINKN